MHFSRHPASPSENAYVAQALASGTTSGDGPFGLRASQLLSALHANARVMLTTSGTHALELAGLTLKLAPGDEVVLPSFTFSSPANAFALRGCTLCFADVDPETFSMEAEQALGAITARTKAVISMAYGGVQRDLRACARSVASG